MKRKTIFKLLTLIAALSLDGSLARADGETVTKRKVGPTRIISIDNKCSFDVRQGSAAGTWVPYAYYEMRVCAESISYKAIKTGKNWNARYSPVPGTEVSTFKTEGRRHVEDVYSLHIESSAGILPELELKNLLKKACEGDRLANQLKEKEDREKLGPTKCE